jgi:hypothetical protein
MELAVAHVDRKNARSARLQEAVGEATGRCTHVRAIASRDDHAKLVERVLQLLSTARHEARWPIHVQLGALVQLLARLVMPENQARKNQRVRLSTGFREPALDQQDVEALLHTSRLAISDWGDAAGADQT